MSFVVLVESSRLKECVAYLFSFHISKNQKKTLFKGAKVPSPLKDDGNDFLSGLSRNEVWLGHYGGSFS